MLLGAAVEPDFVGKMSRLLAVRNLKTYLECDTWIDKERFAFYDTQRKSGWVEIPGIRPSRQYARDVKRAG